MSIERMKKARSGLIASEPFFGSLSYRLEFVPDAKAASTWTDGRRLGFNPEWAQNTPMPHIEAAIAHQVLSCALGHHLRRGTRDKKHWNEASDIVINAELKRAKFDLPDGSLLDPTFDGQYVEQVYKALHAQQEPGNEQGAGGSGDGSGSPQGAPGGDAPDKSGQSSQSAPDAPQPGQSGGAGDASTGTLEDPTDEAGEEADSAERAEQAQEWAEATAQAAQAARGCGKLPGSIERQVENALNAKVDWREALQRLLKARAKDDYSWSKPNRRFISQGLYLPSLDSPTCGPIAFAVDLSGSIKQSDIDQAVAELEEVRGVIKPEKIIVLLFDTQVRKTMEFLPDDPLEVKARAGGGTAFDDPVYELERMNITPEALVYLTDLDASAFAPEPEYPVIWVSTKKTAAPYGEVILMH